VVASVMFLRKGAGSDRDKQAKSEEC